MARKKLPLWFTRLDRSGAVPRSPIVFVFTATDETSARAHAMSMVAEHCRAEYSIERIEVICQTSDRVDGFEPC